MSLGWKDVGEMVGKVAPLLGSVLGGPMGAAAGSLIASAFDVEANPNAIATVASNPEAMVKLRALEAQERTKLLDWYTDQLRLEVEDRKSARESSVKGGDRKMLFGLSIFVLCVVFGLEGAAMYFPTAPGMSEASVGRVLGGLDAIASFVVSFWFGRTNQDGKAPEFFSSGKKGT